MHNVRCTFDDTSCGNWIVKSGESDGKKNRMIVVNASIILPTYKHFNRELLTITSERVSQKRKISQSRNSRTCTLVLLKCEVLLCAVYSLNDDHSSTTTGSTCARYSQVALYWCEIGIHSQWKCHNATTDTRDGSIWWQMRMENSRHVWKDGAKDPVANHLNVCFNVHARRAF